MGKSNYEKEQLLEQFSEDKIPEINDDPQENYDNSSNDENGLSSQTRTLHKEVLIPSSFEAGHLDKSSCSTVQVNDPAELFVVCIEPGVSQAAAVPLQTSFDSMFAQPAAINSFAFAPFDKAAESPMEESSSDSADPLAFASPTTAVVGSWPVELGAEVVCCQGDSSPVNKVGEVRDSEAKQSFAPAFEPIQRSPSIRQPFFEPVQRSNSIRQPSFEPVQRYNSIRQPSFEPVQRSNSIRQPSFEPVQRSNSIRQPSYEPVQRSPLIRQPSFEPVQRSPLIRQPSFEPVQRSFSVGQPSVQRLDRRISYEEVVHTEMDPAEDERKQGNQNSFEDMNFEQCLLCLTQWVLTLQDVLDDRHRMGLLVLNKSERAANCSCRKSMGIIQQLLKVDKCFALASVDQTQHDFHMQNLRQTLDEFQETLRMDVSIQISNPSQEVVGRSINIISKIVDLKDFVREALATILRFVNLLLLIAFCPEHNSKGGIMERDGEGDIRSRVASLMSEDKSPSSQDSDVTMSVDDSSNQNPDKQQSGGRKRKQIFPKVICPVSPNAERPQKYFSAQSAFIRTLRRTPPTSPTSSSSPSKRPRRLSRPTVTNASTMTLSPSVASSAFVSSSVSPSSTPALELLETKKKGQRSGLYQWVLWREALKGEKDRRAANTPRSASPKRSDATTFQPIQRRHSEMSSWRKLSFS